MLTSLDADRGRTVNLVSCNLEGIPLGSMHLGWVLMDNGIFCMPLRVVGVHKQHRGACLPLNEMRTRWPLLQQLRRRPGLGVIEHDISPPEVAFVFGDLAELLEVRVGVGVGVGGEARGGVPQGRVRVVLLSPRNKFGKLVFLSHSHFKLVLLLALLALPPRSRNLIGRLVGRTRTAPWRGGPGVLGVEGDKGIFGEPLGRSIDIQDGLELGEVFQGLQIFRDREVVLSADLSQGDDGVAKGDFFLSDECLLDWKDAAGRVHVLVDDADDPDDHVLLPALAQQVLLGHVFVDILVAPNLEPAPLADVEHIFEHLKVPKVLKQDFEALERDCQAVEGIPEGDFVDFGEVGDYPFVVDPHFELGVGAVGAGLEPHEEGGDEVGVLVPGDEGLELAVDVLGAVEGFPELHDFLGVVEVAVDAEGTVAVGERVVVHLGGVLGQFLPSVFGVPHLNYQYIHLPNKHQFTMNQSKSKRRTKRKFLQPCKYYEMASIDIDKMKLERYFVPMALNAPVNKNKLDKKVVEVEEGLADLYLRGPRSWNEPASLASLTSLTSQHNDYSLNEKEYQEYSYEDRYQDEMIQDEYEI